MSEDEQEAPASRGDLHVDVNDVFTFLGLGLVALGVTVLFGWPWAALVMGLVFVGLGLLGAWQNAHQPEEIETLQMPAMRSDSGNDR